MVTLDNWRARMSEDMRLRDLRPRTHDAYLASVRQFMDRVGKAPEALTDEDVRGYFLYLREDRKLAPSSIHLAVHALRFFFLQTLRREWTVFELLRVRPSKRLPVVLARSEVRALLGAVRHPVRRMALATIYALGLRLGEGLRLEAGHVDAERLLVWVRDGKGAKDRSVPLPRPLLERLRSYWRHERPQSHSSYFFVPSEPFAAIELRRRGAPLSQSTFQMTFRAACRDADIRKPATIHTLRHSYGTHLLEAGISLRTIQHVLGHKSLRTTSLYMHVTTPGFDKLQETIDRLMTDL